MGGYACNKIIGIFLPDAVRKFTGAGNDASHL
jgi:hypothetical protein